MEVDGGSDDSDATVAGEEDLPANMDQDVRSAGPTSATMTGPDGGSLSAVNVATAAQSSGNRRGSDVESEEADPVSPSLLHGHTASKSCFAESSNGKQR